MQALVKVHRQQLLGVAAHRCFLFLHLLLSFGQCGQCQRHAAVLRGGQGGVGWQRHAVQAGQQLLALAFQPLTGAACRQPAGQQAHRQHQQRAQRIGFAQSLAERGGRRRHHHAANAAPLQLDGGACRRGAAALGQLGQRRGVQRLAVGGVHGNRRQAGGLCQCALQVVGHPRNVAQRDAQPHGAADLQRQRLRDRFGHGLRVFAGIALGGGAQVVQRPQRAGAAKQQRQAQGQQTQRPVQAALRRLWRWRFIAHRPTPVAGAGVAGCVAALRPTRRGSAGRLATVV